MSGRVHITLPDGRRVRGFRKTMRRQTPSSQMPDWVIVLRRSDFGLLLLPSGETNFHGVRVYADGVIEARGKSRAWVSRQMESFMASLGIVTELPMPKRMKV